MATIYVRAIDEEAPLRAGELDGLTLDAFLALPEAKPALEYEAGRVTQKVPPQGQHSRLQFIIAALFEQAGRPKVALAFPELRTTYNGRSYVPDVAVYAWSRIPRTAEGDVADRFTAPPDIAVEIVSPAQTVAEQTAKCLWYVANGVRIALVVNPHDRSVRLLRPGHAPLTLRGTDVMDFDEVLPGFQISVQELFATLRLD
jgi:Uma2 family endonuclease